MANYGVKYRFQFQSDAGRDYLVYLEKKGYIGNPIERSFGGSPVLKREKNGRIYGTSLTLKLECLVDQEFAELYNPDSTMWRVELLENIENTDSPTLFIGFLDPEMYSEPDIWPPYDVEVTATCGLGRLKDIDFDPEGPTTASYGSVIRYILNQTGLTSDLGIWTDKVEYIGSPIMTMPISSGSQDTGEGSPLVSMQINDLSIYEDKSCYEVLEDLLTICNMNITVWRHYGGACGWLIFRNGGFVDGATNLSVWDGTQNPPLTSRTTVSSHIAGLSKSDADASYFWPVGHLSSKIEPAKKSVKVSCEYDYDRELLVNPDLGQYPTEGVSGWTLGGKAIAMQITSVDYNYGSGTGSLLSGVYLPALYSARLEQTLNIPADIEGDLCLKISLLYMSGGAKKLRERISLEVINTLASPFIAYSPLNPSYPLCAVTSYHLAPKAKVDDSDNNNNQYYSVEEGTYDDTKWQIDNNVTAFSRLGGPSGTTTDNTTKPGEISITLHGVKQGTLLIRFKGDDNSSCFINSCSLRSTGKNALKGAAVTVNIANGARNAVKEVTVQVISGNGGFSKAAKNALLNSSRGTLLDGIRDGVISASRTLEYLAMDMAREVALPRLRVQGTLQVPTFTTFPLILRKISGGNMMDFFLETFSWNLLNDEMEVELVSLPSADIDVTSLTVTTSEKK